MKSTRAIRISLFLSLWLDEDIFVVLDKKRQ